MKNIVLLLIITFPSIVWGQSYVGNYSAGFMNIFSGPKISNAEFEVKNDDSIIGKVTFGEETIQLRGIVGKKGKFEIVSQEQANTVYKLKGRFDSDGKILFIKRIQIGSGLNKSISENSTEGYFKKIATIVEAKEKPNNIDSSLVDNGKSQLLIQQSKPIFENYWTDFSATVTYKNNGNTPSFRIVLFKVSSTRFNRILSILVPDFGNTTKYYDAKIIDYASYIERGKNSERINSYSLSLTIYTNNATVLTNSGFEIIKENDTQIVFKLVHLKLKKIAENDWAEINGFIYADKIK